MTKQEADGIGGILGDEMGLGKTVEMMACMIANTFPKKQKTLIVCPVSLVFHWKKEIETKTHGVLNDVYVYHGANRKRSKDALAKFDVVITTFNTMASEIKFDKVRKQDIIMKGPLLGVKWNRVILDEAHTIKNKSTRTARGCCELMAKKRWALSGTPIQNHLDDMYSLLKFLQVPNFQDYPYWKESVLKEIMSDPEKGFLKLRNVLHKFVLRRTKNQMINGKPILVLPERVEETRVDEFSPEEKDIYDALWQQSKVQFDKWLRAGTLVENFSNILVLLLRLRQACDHPILALGADQLRKSRETALKELAAPEIPQNNGGANLECPICMDVRQSPYVTRCGHVFCRDCIFPDPNDVGSEHLCPVCRQEIPPNSLVPYVEKSRGKEEEFTGPEVMEGSTKIKSLILELNNMKSEDTKRKCLVFSQWTSMLGIVETQLHKSGYKTLTFDGTLSISQRNKVLSQFENDDTVTVMLMSLKAGGVGLNLVVASVVFFLDLVSFLSWCSHIFSGGTPQSSLKPSIELTDSDRRETSESSDLRSKIPWNRRYYCFKKRSERSLKELSVPIRSQT
eukprot:TRINITY_DN9837_c0_g1_i1.p2 TRINITY_DN9837_c0_g1~~TRINITY_DN9837_c0_g1_i1.p2  ORF type:complete len:567 (-),score=125.32 TRINITY_DN9837_c0_g1_i1:2047-3747(-)